MTMSHDKSVKPDIHRVNSVNERMVCADIMVGSEPWITLGISREQVMRALNDPLNEVFAAYIGDDMVGTMIIQTRGAFSGYLKSIAVKSSLRGKKLGTYMMEFAEKRVFAECANLFLCVSSFNLDARRFYSKLGYKEVGELKNYLVEGYDEIILRKTVAPILQ